MTTATRTDKSRRIEGPPPAHKPVDDSAPPRVWPKWALLMRQDYEQKIGALTRRIRELESKLNNNTHVPTKYGSKGELAEVRERVTLMPNAEQLGKRGITLVAQVAHLMDLNPFTELHAWIDRGRLQIMVDYKALIRVADQDGDLVWDTRPMTAAEREERALDDDEIGYVTEVTQISKAQALAAIGLAARYTPVMGYGIVKRKEHPPHGRDHAWLAGKRSLRDAMNQIASFADAARRINAAIQSSGTDYAETADGWAIDHDGAPDDEAVIIDGDTGEIVAHGDAGTAASPCAACGDRDAEPSNPVDGALCHDCATAQADTAATE